MQNFRCQCKKITFQLEGDTIIIKCRHCKRYIYITTSGIENIEFKNEIELDKNNRMRELQLNTVRLS